MPTDFGEITAYHREEAARHYAMAQAARDRECFGEAEYQACLAARWDEAGAGADDRDAAGTRPPRRISEARLPVPGAAAHSVYRRMLVSHSEGHKRIALAIRQPLPKRTAPIEWYRSADRRQPCVTELM